MKVATMQYHPRISVVMTVYNDEAFVADAVRGILDQSFQDFEVLIVDDGAKDNSVGVVQQISDSRIRLIRQANTGLAGALNRGIAEARGTYIARQDADDVSAPDRLQQQYAFLEKHPAVGLVGTQAYVIDEQGATLFERVLPHDNRDLQEALIGGKGNPFVHGSTMFRKCVAEQAGLYRREFRRCQDYDLWLRMSEQTELANIPEFLYSWRLRRGGAGTVDWGGYGDYARLAFLCAKRRRDGRPEPLLSVEQVRRAWFAALTRPLRTPSDPALAFTLLEAQSHLMRGELAAARMASWQVMRRSPATLYAWLLFGLAWCPRWAASRLWQGMRAAYRLGTWKR